jgi:hypothetical protein
MSTTYSQGLAAGTSRTSGISSASCQNNKAYIGSAIDNATNLDVFADIELVWSFGTNPTAGNSLKLHLLWSQDGTNYEEGTGDGTTLTSPLPGCLVGTVSPAADTSTHRKLFRDIPLAPYKFKVLGENTATGQTATLTVNVYTRKDQTIG